MGSIPKMLRIYFKYDRKLLTRLCHCAKESLRMFFRTVLGLNDGILGVIMLIHTFGDYARFHPHLHAIVADGLFRPNGTFWCLPKRDLKEKESRLGSSDPAMSRRPPRAIPRRPCSMGPSTNLGGFRPRPGGNSSRKSGKWTLSAVPDAAVK